MRAGRCLWAAAFLLLTLVVGCGTTVEYGDATAVETVTVDFGSTDLQMIAEKMVQSMLASPVIAENNRPVVQVSSVKNQTGEHIDTKAITDKIRTTLLKSGKVQFSASEVREEMIDELHYQRDSGYVDPATQTQVGQHVGASYLITGDIASIKKSKDGTKDVYYKITLNLVDLQTGLISWADEKEIRKRED
jgi:hypothetical protein